MFWVPVLPELQNVFDLSPFELLKPYWFENNQYLTRTERLFNFVLQRMHHKPFIFSVDKYFGYNLVTVKIPGLKKHFFSLTIRNS